MDSKEFAQPVSAPVAEAATVRRAMRFLVLCLPSLVLPVLAAPTGLSPSGGKTVALLDNVQSNYLYKMSVDERSWVMSEKSSTGKSSRLSGFTATTFSVGSPVKLSWKDASGTCLVSVKRLSDGKVISTATVSGTSASVVNLEIDAEYEWTVTDSSGTSAPAKFHTAGEPPRLIKSGEMKVMRDLGGWTGLAGRKVRQNQLFRGGPAESDYKQKPNRSLVDDAAREFFYNVVGLKTEVDMRYATGKNAQTGDYPRFDMTGAVVNYLNLYVYWSGLYYASDTSAEGRNWGEILRKVVDPEARPLYFHCSAGRDRTGLIAGLTLALLGVDEDSIMRDYQATCYLDGSNGTSSFHENIFETIAAFSNVKKSLAENTAAYFMSFGITEEQIEDFRTDMLIGYGEPPKPTYWVEEPVYVTATRITFAAGEQTGEQYTGFLTKKGFWYAWGTNGVAGTEWKQSDGTPMELEKPKGDGWELMVRE